MTVRPQESASTLGGPQGLSGRTLAGGRRSRERIARMLGVAALTRQNVRVRAIGWMKDHVEVEVEGSRGETVLLAIERFQEGRPGLLHCGEVTLVYRGKRIDALIEGVLRKVAPRALRDVCLDDLARLLLSDPEAGGRDQPLPAAPREDQTRFAEQALLSSWGAQGVWRQFFAVAEIARAQLDSLDIFNRSLFVQHCEAECLAIAPQTGVDMIPLALYPWDDRIRRIDWGGARPRRPPEHHRLITTDLDEQDVILGRGPRKLDEALDHVGRIDTTTSSMIFCSSTCLPVVAGEDIEELLRRHERRLSLPLLHLTTTPHSMQTLLTDLLVTRRLEAEASSAPKGASARPSVNLVGFPEGPGLEELRAALDALGISVNVALIPALESDLLEAYPMARLSVLSPNELWQGHYSQLLAGSRLPDIAPPPPFGREGTRRWLETIAAALDVRADATEVMDGLWSPHADEWESLVSRARRHSLGFVVPEVEIDFLTNPAKTWGVPLIPVTTEMGFRVVVLIEGGDVDDSSARAALEEVSRGRVEVRSFTEREELSRLLAGSELSAAFSEHFFDRRLTESGLASFSLQHFEHGFGGAVRSLRRLVELCELPFFRRYCRLMARGASRHRSPFGLRGSSMAPEE